MLSCYLATRHDLQQRTTSLVKVMNWPQAQVEAPTRSRYSTPQCPWVASTTFLNHSASCVDQYSLHSLKETLGNKIITLVLMVSAFAQRRMNLTMFYSFRKSKPIQRKLFIHLRIEASIEDLPVCISLYILSGTSALLTRESPTWT